MSTDTSKEKSLESYIGSFISTLEYSDFSPPINNINLMKKFKEFLESKNCFWEIYKTEDRWDKWIFIELKSFEKNNVVRLGLMITSLSISYVIFEHLDHDFSPKYDEGKIELYQAWLKHTYLKDELTSIILKSIEIANSSLKIYK
jgi:hypothetical protein